MFWLSKTNITKLDTEFRAYLLHYLLPLMGATKEACRVTIPVSGVKTSLRLIEITEPASRYCGAVVKIFPKSEKKRLQQIIHIAEFLQKNDVPIPKILDLCDKFDKSGIVFLAEELICGPSALEIEMTPELSVLLAQSLRALHSINKNTTDVPLRYDLVSTPYKKEMLNRVGHRLFGLNRYADSKSIKYAVPKISAWFEKESKSLIGCKSLQLVHDKMHPGNIIFCERRRTFFIIDIETVSPGCALKDLVQIYHDVLHEDDELMRAFKDVYFQEPAPLPAEKAEHHMPFFDAYYHLARASINFKRLHKDLKRQNLSGDDIPDSIQHFRDNAHLHVEELFRLIGMR